MTTKIEWTDETWNPVTGCSKVSQGCKNCYAERLWPKVEAAERKRHHWEWNKVPRRPFTDVRTHPDRLEMPLRWGRPRRVFVNSMSDLFHEALPFEFIADVFAVMACTTRHKYQVLTKRPQRMIEWFKWLRDEHDAALSLDQARRWWPHAWPAQVQPLKVWPQWTPARGNRGGYDNCGPSWPLENVWLGVSVEDQATADERIPLLLQTPAAVRFVSYEPALGPVNFEPFLQYEPFHENYKMTFDMQEWEGLNWIIVGGESGPGARPAHPDWFRSARDQCAAAGVPFFFKQWGEWAPDNCQGPNKWQHLERPQARWIDGAFKLEQPTKWPDDENLMFRLGKKNSGREIDGREHSEYPA